MTEGAALRRRLMGCMYFSPINECFACRNKLHKAEFCLFLFVRIRGFKGKNKNVKNFLKNIDISKILQ